jgi:hypothetical protein
VAVIELLERRGIAGAQPAHAGEVAVPIAHCWNPLRHVARLMSLSCSLRERRDGRMSRSGEERSKGFRGARGTRPIGGSTMDTKHHLVSPNKRAEKFTAHPISVAARRACVIRFDGRPFSLEPARATAGRPARPSTARARRAE